MTAFSVAVTLGSSRKMSAPFRPLVVQAVAPVGFHGGAEPGQGEEVRVHAPAADDVAAGRRQHHVADPGEHGPGEQDGCPDARGGRRRPGR
jgi:hypothetical protein